MVKGGNLEFSAGLWYSMSKSVLGSEEEEVTPFKERQMEDVHS